MKNILTELKVASLISFLLLLSFMILEWVNRRSSDELFPILLFAFLWLGLLAISLVLVPLAQNLRAGNRDLAEPRPAPGNGILSNPVLAAIISFLLALPFLTILSLVLLQIEPPSAAAVNSLPPFQKNALGTLIVLGALSLAIAAAFIVRQPIVQGMRTGRGLFAHPLNLALAVVIMGFMAVFVVGLIMDQLPCFLGVPNCD